MQHLEPLDERRLLAGVSADPAYGRDGTEAVRFPHGTGNTIVAGMVTDGQGNAYVAASRKDDAGYDLQIRRLTPSGTLDHTWAVKQGGDLAFENATGAILHTDPENRLDILIGSKLYRYSADGTLDSGFGIGGVATLTIRPEDFTIDRSGRIWVAGAKDMDPGKGVTNEMVVQRLISRGRIDRTFGRRGSFLEPAGFIADKISALTDGTVVVGGRQGGTVRSGAFGVKFNADGSLARTYGDHGISRIYVGTNTDISSTAITVSAIRPDGAIDLTTAYQRDDVAPEFGAAYISPTGKTAATSDVTTPDYNPEDDDRVAPVSVMALRDGLGVAVVPLNGVGSRNGLYLLTSDGTYDAAFNSGKAIADVDDIAVTPDGSVLTLYQGTDGTIDVRRYDLSSGPSVTLAKKVPTVIRQANSVKFRVEVSDHVGVDTATLTRNSLTITDPLGHTYRPNLVSVASVDGGTDVATFKVAAYNGLPFSSSDNTGTYAIEVTAGAVRDRQGNATVGHTIGTFLVDLT